MRPPNPLSVCMWPILTGRDGRQTHFCRTWRRRWRRCGRTLPRAWLSSVGVSQRAGKKGVPRGCHRTHMDGSRRPWQTSRLCWRRSWHMSSRGLSTFCVWALPMQTLGRSPLSGAHRPAWGEVFRCGGNPAQPADQEERPPWSCRKKQVESVCLDLETTGMLTCRQQGFRGLLRGV